MGGNVTNYNFMPATAIATKGTKESVLSPVSGGQLALNSVGVSLAAAACDTAWGYKLPNAMWGAGQWVNATTTFTDDTIDAQDAGADDFPLSTLSANDGFIVYADRPFNAVGFTVGTATVGGSPAYDYMYWNGAWTALTTKAVPGYTAADQFWIFLKPWDWAVTTASAGTGVPVGKYAVRLRATTAPSTTAPLATIMWVCQFVAYNTAQVTNTKLTTSVENTEMVLPGGASLIGYWATANAGNFLECMYRSIGVYI